MTAMPHVLQKHFRALATDLSAPWRVLPDLPQALGASELRRRIIRRQFRELMRESTANVMATAVGIGLWMMVLWVTNPGPAVLLWGLAVSTVLARIATLTKRFVRETPPDDALRAWESRLGRVAFVGGLAWGSVGFFVPVQAEQLMPYLVIGLLFVMVGSLSLFVVYRPSTIWHSVPCAAMTCLSLVARGGALNVTIGLGFVVAVALATHFVRMQNALMTRTQIQAEERLILLRELEDQRLRAEHANRAKTNFLAAVSHDLRQPMHSIALLTGALCRPLIAHADLVGQIGASVQAIDNLLGALLEVSALDGGNLPLQIAPLDLGALFGRIELQFAAQALAKGVELRIAPSTARVVSDAFQLQRLLANLVSNAIRYTPRGCVLVRCRVRAGSAWVQVWDSGVGIAREHRHCIFDEFFQVARGAHTGKQGLGLGLSIVQRLAQHLAHPITLRSRVRRGSVFAVGVPLAADCIDEDRPINQAERLPA